MLPALLERARLPVVVCIALVEVPTPLAPVSDTEPPMIRVSGTPSSRTAPPVELRVTAPVPALMLPAMMSAFVAVEEIEIAPPPVLALTTWRRSPARTSIFPPVVAA